MLFDKMNCRKCFRRIITTLLCLTIIMADIYLPSYVKAASSSDLTSLGSTVSTPPVYDETTGYYVQTITEVNTQFNPAINCNVTTRIVTTMYYLYDSGAYRLVSKSEQSEIISSIPVNDPAFPTAYPQQTAMPSPADSPTPAVPTATPVPFTMRTSPMKLKVSRSSDKKAKLTWKTVNNADGYTIYRSTKEKGDFKKVKTILDPERTTYISGGLSKNKVYYYIITAYQTMGSVICETELNTPVQVSTITVKKISQKLNKLKKKFPDGKYWNHVGCKVSAGQDVSGFVTDKPCNHNGYANGVAPSCNYYLGTDGVLGYQCSGYASLLSDKIFSKTKYKKHTSFKKSKVGDVVRYSGHSVLITEKHSDYIVVTECNYGNTCIIKWGRKIAKSKLSGAVYHTRY